MYPSQGSGAKAVLPIAAAILLAIVLMRFLPQPPPDEPAPAPPATPSNVIALTPEQAAVRRAVTMVYQAMGKAIQANDLSGSTAALSPDYRARKQDGIYSRQEIVRALGDKRAKVMLAEGTPIRATLPVVALESKSYLVQKVTVRAGRAQVLVTETAEVRVRDPHGALGARGATHQIAARVPRLDTWIKADQGWRLARSEVIAPPWPGTAPPAPEIASASGGPAGAPSPPLTEIVYGP